MKFLCLSQFDIFPCSVTEARVFNIVINYGCYVIKQIAWTYFSVK